METAEGPIMEETDALGILFVDWGVEEWKPVGKVYKIDHW